MILTLLSKEQGEWPAHFPGPGEVDVSLCMYGDAWSSRNQQENTSTICVSNDGLLWFWLRLGKLCHDIQSGQINKLVERIMWKEALVAPDPLRQQQRQRYNRRIWRASSGPNNQSMFTRILVQYNGEVLAETNVCQLSCIALGVNWSIRE